LSSSLAELPASSTLASFASRRWFSLVSPAPTRLANAPALSPRYLTLRPTLREEVRLLPQGFGFADGSIRRFLVGCPSLCGNLLRWRGIRRFALSGATQRYGGALREARAQRFAHGFWKSRKALSASSICLRLSGEAADKLFFASGLRLGVSFPLGTFIGMEFRRSLRFYAFRKKEFSERKWWRYRPCFGGRF
jgi:hypothetical protein